METFICKTTLATTQQKCNSACTSVKYLPRYSTKLCHFFIARKTGKQRTRVRHCTLATVYTGFYHSTFGMFSILTRDTWRYFRLGVIKYYYAILSIVTKGFGFKQLSPDVGMLSSHRQWQALDHSYYDIITKNISLAVWIRYLLCLWSEQLGLRDRIQMTLGSKGKVTATSATVRFFLMVTSLRL